VAGLVTSDKLLAARSAPDDVLSGDQAASVTLVALRTLPTEGELVTDTPFTLLEESAISDSNSNKALLRVTSQSVCPLAGITNAIIYPP
jgi:hypothetical protein